jgi:hypothetical protein
MAKVAETLTGCLAGKDEGGRMKDEEDVAVSELITSHSSFIPHPSSLDVTAP